jgi:predicted MFS family arabinose efflux permease
MRLVPVAEVPRALAWMYTGQAVAAAFAAPIGSYLGGLIGWRGVFWALVPVVALDLLWQIAALPALPARGRQSLATFAGLLRRPYFLRGLVAAMCIWGSAFSMFTYLRPFLEQVVGAGVPLLSLLFLVLGVAGFPGVWAAGKVVDRHVIRLLAAPPLVMGLVTLGLLAAGKSVVLVGLLLAVWGAMNTAMSIIWMTWLARNVDDAPEEAGSLLVAAIQASILLGAMLGGAVLDAWGISATFLGSVVLAGIAVVLVGSGQRLVNED